jgi:AraC-like DNA-binding protein
MRTSKDFPACTTSRDGDRRTGERRTFGTSSPETAIEAALQRYQPHPQRARLRLETARGLLRDTEMQIQQVAWTVGYGNPGDLSRAFRQRFGMSPRRFRSEVVLGDRGEGSRAT